MLDQIRIVLVNTSHTGNMGSAARAMKTMGLTQLVLVDPQAQPDEEAVALAAGASDILARARIVPTLDEAIADCGLVIGTSARSRTLSWPMLDPREAGEKLVAEALGRIDRFIDRGDHLTDRNLARGQTEAIAATGATYAAHQTMLAQTGKQLFQIGQGDALAL